MDTTPTHSPLTLPANPKALSPSGEKSASLPFVRPKILYPDFATASLLHSRSARTRSAPAFPRLLDRWFTILRCTLRTFWRALVTHACRAPKSLLVAETAALGERRLVAVVQFERHRFLVGASSSSVTLLASLPDAGDAADPCQQKNCVGTELCPAQAPNPAATGLCPGQPAVDALNGADQ